MADPTRGWRAGPAVRMLPPVLAVVALLAGCDGSSGTTERPSAPSSVRASGGSGTSTPESGIAGVVTRAQAASALVTAGDLPDGWARDGSSGDRSRTTTYSPRTCSALGAPVAESSVLARASFSIGGQYAANLTQQVYVPPATSQAVGSRAGSSQAELAKLRERMASCASYRVTTPSGTSTIKVALKPFPTLGDGTLALETQANGALVPVVDDAVYIAAGGQIIRFDSISTGTGLADADLQKLARLSLERLQKAS